MTTYFILVIVSAWAFESKYTPLSYGADVKTVSVHRTHKECMDAQTAVQKGLDTGKVALCVRDETEVVK